MSLSIPIVDGVIDVIEKGIDKLWMDKEAKSKIELSRDELLQKFRAMVIQLNNRHELDKIGAVFKEHQAQRDFASDQFGRAEILKQFGTTGNVILLGRASIRWVITGASMLFTWRIMSTILSPEVIKALAAGTLSTSGSWLITLLVCLIIGIPLFYVSGISIEKILGVRNTI